MKNDVGYLIKRINDTGTVIENLRCGNPDATDEECIAAATHFNCPRRGVRPAGNDYGRGDFLH